MARPLSASVADSSGTSEVRWFAQDSTLIDAETVRVADEAELLRYCYRAAGTVGLMMCRVLDAPEPAAAAHAVDLGIAMQLTNLCRDVADDARMGRRYLPASLTGAGRLRGGCG